MRGRREAGPARDSGRGQDLRRPLHGGAARRTTKNGASGDVASRDAKLKFTSRAAILGLVMLVLAVSYASSARAWLRQRSEINQLTSTIAQQQAAVAELKQTKQRWSDPAYVESQAKARFGFVLPGQTSYRVIGADGSVLSTGTDQLSAPIPSPETTRQAQQQWWQTAWSSLTTAAQEPGTLSKKPSRTPATLITPGHHR